MGTSIRKHGRWLFFTDALGELRKIYSFDENRLEHNIDGSSLPLWCDIQNSDLSIRVLTDHEIHARVLYNFLGEKASLCYVTLPDGKEFDRDPVTICKKAEHLLMEKLGATMKVGSELEFFVSNYSKEPNLRKNNSYYLDASITIEQFLDFGSLSAIASSFHHEVAPGQYEISLKPVTPTYAAGYVQIAKYIIKESLRKHGLRVTFMPKPLNATHGSGMHLHISLWKDGRNLFYDNGELSETALHFIAGILFHAKSLTAFTNPTVNSFMRLVPGFGAPVYIAYGKSNRSALIRIPPIKDEKTTRIEIRFPDLSCNPYLAFASILLAGMDGILRRLKAPQPIEENLYEIGKVSSIDTLPSSLLESLYYLEHNEESFRLFSNVFSSFLDSYLSFKKEEARAEKKGKTSQLEYTLNPCDLMQKFHWWIGELLTYSENKSLICEYCGKPTQRYLIEFGLIFYGIPFCPECISKRDGHLFPLLFDPTDVASRLEERIEITRSEIDKGKSKISDNSKLYFKKQT